MSDLPDDEVAVPLLVDGNNVMGATPDGWWRDRAGAARRLADRIGEWAAATGRPVTVVFDAPARDLPEGGHGAITVRYATRKGRDAADDRIVALVEESPVPVEVVTSDRGLAARVTGAGATVQGAGTFLGVLRG
jgi:predicted RNA-binding protein with PIN domain